MRNAAQCDPGFLDAVALQFQCGGDRDQREGVGQAIP
jgi:hypothetical protein